MNATILGAGPSGLMAAWAAEMLGYNVMLYDAAPAPPNGRSAGVFYLHDDCDLPREALRSANVMTWGSGGSADDYRTKVYGAGYTGRVSFPEEHYDSTVFDGIRAMMWLWTHYEQGSAIRKHSFRDINDVLAVAHQDAGPVINTIPLPALYPARSFPSQRVFAEYCQAPALADLDGFVMYDADAANPIYRTSCIFGRITREYVPGVDPRPLHEVDEEPWETRLLTKVMPLEPDVLRTLTDHPGVIFTGRYGAWNKHFLTHSVYEDTKEQLRERPSG